MRVRWPMIAAALLVTTGGAVSADDLRRDVDGGAIVGAVAGDRVWAFKGIPYAAPPTGDLRWQAPQPAPPWEGVRDATRFGPDCLQEPEPSDAAPPSAALAEDCLFVNVWTPAGARPDNDLPVLVWIHGGGFVNGGSSPAVYDGAAFARSGLVFVSLNYRLGRFGFFAHPALVEEGGSPGGNFGLLDQVAALEWVQRNIGGFGGDPGRVTLIGQSAGGASVLYHLALSGAADRFQQAIVMSGGGRDHLLGGLPVDGPAPSGTAAGRAFAGAQGVDGDGPEALAALRALPAATLAEGLSLSALLGPLDTYAGGPLVDGVTVSAAPEEAMQSGTAAAMPLLIGTTNDDLPIALAALPPQVFAHFEAEAKTARSAYAGLQDDLLGAAVAIAADLGMHEPARFAARQTTTAGAPAWLYRFGYVSEYLRATTDGAGHATELPFLFRTLDARYGADVAPADRTMGEELHARVVAFVRNGTPNAPDLANWPELDPAARALMRFTSDRGAVFESDPWARRIALIERLRGG